MSLRGKGGDGEVTGNLDDYLESFQSGPDWRAIWGTVGVVAAGVLVVVVSICDAPFAIATS